MSQASSTRATALQRSGNTSEAHERPPEAAIFPGPPTRGTRNSRATSSRPKRHVVEGNEQLRKAQRQRQGRRNSTREFRRVQARSEAGDPAAACARVPNATNTCEALRPSLGVGLWRHLKSPALQHSVAGGQTLEPGAQWPVVAAVPSGNCGLRCRCGLTDPAASSCVRKPWLRPKFNTPERGARWPNAVGLCCGFPPRVSVDVWNPWLRPKFNTPDPSLERGAQ